MTEQQQASKDDVPEWARRARIEADGLRYRINNPSAWEAYSEEGSEQLRHAVNVLDDILAATEQASKDAPRLLTEREWRDLLERNTEDGVIDELRDLGLILPEPVDALAEVLKGLLEPWLDLAAADLRDLTRDFRARLPGIDELARGVTLASGGEKPRHLSPENIARFGDER